MCLVVFLFDILFIMKQDVADHLIVSEKKIKLMKKINEYKTPSSALVKCFRYNRGCPVETTTVVWVVVTN